MTPRSNIDVAHKKDIEKDIEKNLEVEVKTRPKSSILIITALELIFILALIHNRDYLDSVHQMLNSVLLGTLTAGFAQSVIQLYRYVNYPRLVKFYIWGAINGILSSLWIDALVYNVPSIAHQILIDQCLGSPLFQSIFIVYNCIWENNDIVPAFQSTFVRVMLSSYMIWPACSIVSFNFLPPYYIFPFNCFVNVIWTLVVGLLV